MARQTVAQWLKAHVQELPDVEETLLPAAPNDVLGVDEIWSCVQKKDHPRWVWTAMCRRTRQIVAFVRGDRSKSTCLRFWSTIPEGYKHCHTDHVISGLPPNTFSRLKPISVLERKLGRLHIWSGGIIHYVNALVVTPGRRSPFPNLTFTIIYSPSGLLCNTIWAYHLQLNHYRFLEP